MELNYGDLTRFHGALVAHFAPCNTTDCTRVSLDFRVMPGECYDPDPEAQGEHALVGRYYSECARAGPGAPFEKTRSGRPYYRMGFPHTNA